MLTVTKPAPDRVDVALSGAVDAAAMRVGLDELIRLSDGVKNGRMLYRITDLAWPVPFRVGNSGRTASPLIKSG